MACQLAEAIALINTKPATRNALKAVEQNGKIAETVFGELVLREYGESPSELSLKEFSKGLGKLIRNVTNVKITKSKQYALDQIRAGMVGFEISNMKSYTSNIELAGYVTSDEIRGTISEDFYKGIVDNTLKYATITDEASMVDALNSEVSNAFNAIKDARGSHFLLHELLHAGANEYMANNPNEPATKRIETVYNYVISNYKDLGITDGYWKTNVEEFLAEALSNPEFMKELMAVVPTKPVNRLSNMYEIVLNSLLQMLGLQNDKLNSLFDVLLDANLKILEKRDKQLEVKEMNTTDTVTKAKEVVEDKVVTEEVKEAPAKPTASRKYVNDFLNVDIESLDIGTLYELEGKDVNVKDESNEVVKAVETTKEDIRKKISKIVGTAGLTPEQSARVDAKIKKLLDRKKYLLDEVNEMDLSITEVNEELDRSSEVAKELYSLYNKKSELRKEGKELEETLTKTYNKVRALISEFRNRDTRKGYAPIEEIEFDNNEKSNYTTVLRKLKENVDELEQSNGMFKEARIKIAKLFAYIVSKLVRAKTAYNKAIKASKANTGALEDINTRIAELEASAIAKLGDDWKTRRKEAKKAKGEILEKFGEVKVIKTKLKPLQDKKKGIGKIVEILATKHHTKESAKAINKKFLETPGADPKKAEFRAEKAVNTTLATMLATGTPTSELAAVEITDEDLASIFNMQTDEFGDMEANALLKDNKADELARFAYKMLMRNPDGTLNRNVASAMRIALEKYVAENAQQLTQLSPKDLMSMYGKTEETVWELSQDRIEGGVPQVYMSADIGKDIAKMLGIKPLIVRNKDGEITKDTTEFYEKISIGIGQAALMHGAQIGMLEEVVVGKDEEAQVYTYKLNEASRDDLINYQAGRKDFVKRMEERFGVEPKAKGLILTEAVERTPEEVTKRNEPLTKPTKVVIEAILKNEAEAWKPTVKVVDDLLSLPLEILYKHLGYKDADEAGLTYEQQISRIGKNRQIEQDVENLQALKDAMDEGVDSAYFKWFVAKNSRQMLDGEGGLNPQGIKLHRYALSTEGMRGTVDKSKDAMSETMFKLGFAQGFGFGIDKNAIENSIAFADALLKPKALEAIKIAVEAGNSELVIKSGGKDHKLKFKEISHTVLSLSEGAKYVEAKGSPFKTSMVVEVDGLTNGFAHKIMQYLATSTTDVTTIDAKTVEWLEKVGVSFGTIKDTQDMVSKIQAGKDGDAGGIVDAYLTLAEELTPVTEDDLTSDVLIDSLVKRMEKKDKEAEAKALKSKHGESILAKVDDDRNKRFGTADKELIIERAKAVTAMMPDLRDSDGALTDTARDLMKPPFMTFGYAAGFESMSNNITSNIIDDIMNDVLNKKTPEVNALIKALGITDVKGFKKSLRATSYGNIKLPDGRNLLSAMRGLVLGVYGDTIADVMTATFGGIKEINDSILEGSNVIFHIFHEAYRAELAKIGITGKEVPSKKEHDKVIAILRARELLPVIKGPVSEEYDEGIALYGSKSELAAENVYGDITYDLGNGNTRNVAAKRRTYDGPGASGVVAMTNIEDSLGTALTTNRESLLHIFDAYILGVNQSNVAADTNKDFMEMNMMEDWSQLEAVTEALSNMITIADKHYPGLTTNVADVIAKESADRVGFAVEAVQPATLASSLVEMNDKANARREIMRESNVVGEQIVLDKEHAYEYKGGKTFVSEVKEVESSTTEVTKVKEDKSIPTILRENIDSYDDINIQGDISSMISREETYIPDDYGTITDSDQSQSMEDIEGRVDIQCK